MSENGPPSRPPHPPPPRPGAGRALPRDPRLPVRAHELHEEAAHAGPRPRPLAVEFTGRGGEYFRIWFVNVALSVLTLGVYSAWASVRTRRYFHRHTLIDQAPFDYVADPVRILLGRGLVVGALVLYALGASRLPWLEPLVVLVVLPLVIPWVVVRALVFRARNTVYRGLRFGFDGGWLDAFVAYVALWVLAAISAGLAYPYAVWRRRQFQISGLRLGGTPFSFAAPLGAFYRSYAVAVVLALLGVVLALLVFAPLVMGLLTWARMSGMDPESAGPDGAVGILAPILLVAQALLLYLFAFGSAWCYLAARIPSIVVSHTRVGGVELRLDLPVPGLAWIYLSNLVVVVGTAGLLWPWAKVRLAAFRMRHLLVSSSEPWEAFAGRAGEDAQALGDELGDFLGLDIGF